MSALQQQCCHFHLHNLKSFCLGSTMQATANMARQTCQRKCPQRLTFFMLAFPNVYIRPPKQSDHGTLKQCSWQCVSHGPLRQFARSFQDGRIQRLRCWIHPLICLPLLNSRAIFRARQYKLISLTPPLACPARRGSYRKVALTDIHFSGLFLGSHGNLW